MHDSIQLQIPKDLNNTLTQHTNKDYIIKYYSLETNHFQTAVTVGNTIRKHILETIHKYIYYIQVT